MTITNKYLSTVFCLLSQKCFPLGEHFWLLCKTQWKPKSIVHIFLSGHKLNLIIRQQKLTGHTFSPTLNLKFFLNISQLCCISHPAFCIKFQLPLLNLGQTKRFRHQTLWNKLNLQRPPCVRICWYSVKLPMLQFARSGATEMQTHAGAVGGGMPIKPDSFLYWLPCLKEKPARGRACWEEMTPCGNSWQSWLRLSSLSHTHTVMSLEETLIHQKSFKCGGQGQVSPSPPSLRSSQWITVTPLPTQTDGW